MATVPWPTTLQDLLNTDSFGYKFGETAIRSEMDIGPAKVRRRFTRPVDTMTATINITTAQFPIFYYFYNTSLNGGVNMFSFIHPITRVPMEARFVSAPALSPLGGEVFRVSMEWEILP